MRSHHLLFIQLSNCISNKGIPKSPVTTYLFKFSLPVVVFPVLVLAGKEACRRFLPDKILVLLEESVVRCLVKCCKTWLLWFHAFLSVLRNCLKLIQSSFKQETWDQEMPELEWCQIQMQSQVGFYSHFPAAMGQLTWKCHIFKMKKPLVLDFLTSISSMAQTSCLCAGLIRTVFQMPFRYSDISMPYWEETFFLAFHTSMAVLILTEGELRVFLNVTKSYLQQFGLCVIRTHRGMMFNSASTVTPTSFSEELLLCQSVPTLYWHTSYSIPHLIMF